jgi:hypothetical protein
VVTAVVLVTAGNGAAHAIFLSESGDQATLSGPIGVGDDVRFKEFLERKRATPIRVLWLSSGGGRIKESIGIARMVRRARLTTAVQASRASCDSGCTFIFVAGVKRHYVGGRDVIEGLSSFAGLGFHSASIRGDAVRFTVQSPRGNDVMYGFYREMGVPGAADLARRAPFNSMYRISGDTALRLRIATSLDTP